MLCSNSLILGFIKLESHLHEKSSNFETFTSLWILKPINYIIIKIIFFDFLELWNKFLKFLTYSKICLNIYKATFSIRIKLLGA